MQPKQNSRSSADLARRGVLKWTGAAVALAAFGGALPNFGISDALAADLGQGDVGVLNYAYALEQLEAAFYATVMQHPYAGMRSDERLILSEIGEHETAHAHFLKSALGFSAIPALQVDFSSVNFNSRKSVLTTAKTFEDLGVAAYNGAGRLLTKASHLAAAGSIVSVEARHAATLRDMLQPHSAAFAGPDVVNGNGLDQAKMPHAVLAAAKPFIKTPVTAVSL